MNLIFLDMDGVLNSQDSIINWNKEFGPISEHKEEYNKYFYEDRITKKANGEIIGWIIDPKLRKIFNDMYAKIPDCKVVWSSSWRCGLRNSKLFVEGFYNKCGLPENSFLGYTPVIRSYWRWNEIVSWLNTFKDVYKINKVAILDDDQDAEIPRDEIEIDNKFFRTNMFEGLTQDIANEILNYFNIK